MIAPIPSKATGASLASCLMLAVLHAQPPAHSVLQRIDAVSEPGRTQLTVRMSRAARHTVGSLENPKRLYVDFVNAKAAEALRSCCDFQDSLVQRIRVGAPHSGAVRVVVDLRDNVDSSAVALVNPPRLLLILRGKGAVAPASTSAGVSSTEQRFGTAEAAKPAAVPAFQPGVPEKPASLVTQAAPSANSAESLAAPPASPTAIPASSTTPTPAPTTPTPAPGTFVHRGVVRWQGGVVPGAKVLAILGDSKVSTTTDESGAYQIESLEPGAWKLQVQMFGFQPAERTLIVGSGDAQSSDITLEMKAPPPRSAQSTAAQRAGFQALRQIDGQVQSAVSSSDSSSDSTPGNSANVNEAFLISGSTSQGLSAASSQSLQYGWGESGSGFARGIFGNRGGAAQSSLRGAVLWSLRDSAMDARPYSITGQSVPKSEYSQNRFSIALGGLLPKKLGSFFFNYSLMQGENSYQGFATVPTALERSGDFSQSQARGPVTIYDPLNNAPFPGNRLPQARIHAASMGLAGYIPFLNQPSPSPNYQFVTSTPQRTQSPRAFINLRFRPQDQLMVSVNGAKGSSEQSQLFGYRDSFDNYSYGGMWMWTHRYNARITQGLRLDINRSRSETTPFFAFKNNVAAQLGILGGSQDPLNYGPPNLAFTNFGGVVDASPALRRDQSVVIGYGIYWSHKKHSFGSGFEVYRYQVNNRTDENGRGSYSFSGLLTSGFDSQGLPLPGTGFDYADFLLGLPQTSSVRFGASNNYFRATNYATYLTDDFRILPNLTLSMGFRYEFFGPYSEKYGRLANLDVAPGFTGVSVVTPGQTGAYSGRFPAPLVNSDRNNWSPRFGMSWTPFPKAGLELRAGYGVYYNGGVYAPLALLLASQPPFANTRSLGTSLALPLRIEDGFVSASLQGASIRNTYAVGRGYAVGYAQIWSFAVTKDLPHALVAEIGYVGTKGTRLDTQRLPNRAAPGSPLTAEDRRLIDNASGFVYDSSEGNSILHSAQFRIVRRFQKGMSFNALYTFGKSIDDASSFGGGVAVVAQDDRNLHAERGLSSFDQRHTLTASYMLNSPVGDQGAPIHLSGRAGWLVKNWVFLGNISASSSSFLTARVLGNLSDTGGTGLVGSGRADATGASIDSPNDFFNLGAFMLPPAARFGNAGRNTIPMPARISLNLALGRTFRIDERRALEFRADSSNFVNNVTITNFGATVNAGTYGIAQSAAPMRNISTSLRMRF